MVDVDGVGDLSGVAPRVMLFHEEHWPIVGVVGAAPVRAAHEMGVEGDHAQQAAQAEFFPQQPRGDAQARPAQVGIEE